MKTYYLSIPSVNVIAEISVNEYLHQVRTAKLLKREFTIKDGKTYVAIVLNVSIQKLPEIKPFKNTFVEAFKSRHQ